MNGYVAAGWGVTVLVIVLYSWRTIRRGRVLSRSFPDGEKTWR